MSIESRAQANRRARIADVFDPSRPFVVMKPFNNYEGGDVYPASATTQHRLRQLFDARFIRHSPNRAEDIFLRALLEEYHGEPFDIASAG